MRTKTNFEHGRWLNPPFDPRILSIGPPALGGSKLKRGNLTLATSGAFPHLVGKGVRFLYNPVSVSASHTIDPNNITNVNKQQNAKNRGQVGQMANIGSISLDLLYDRTYEVWSKKDTLAGKYGVYVDILAFYKMLGVVREEHGTDNTNTHAYSYFDLYPAYPIEPDNTYYIYVGDKMRWYGVLTDFEVTYSHWTQDLVPSRAAVSLSMMFQKAPGGSSGQVQLHGFHKIDKSAAKKHVGSSATSPNHTWNNALPGFG